MTQAVVFTIENGVATLSLNRPESRNALNNVMCEEILACIRSVAADVSLRALVVRAEGPVFCAGADLKERKGMSDDAVRARRLKAFTAYHALETLPVPTIAVVEGPAVGSGVEIAAACDFVVATPKAQFRTPEALWGTVGATQRLPRVLGKRLAKDLMFTGRILSAAEAHVAGLVARVVEPGDLASTLAVILGTIRKAPPGALRLAKRCIDQGSQGSAAGALAIELMAIEENLTTQEWKNGVSSFASGGA